MASRPANETPPPILPLPAQVVITETGQSSDFVWAVFRDKSTNHEYFVVRPIWGNAITSQPLDAPAQ